MLRGWIHSPPWVVLEQRVSLCWAFLSLRARMQDPPFGIHLCGREFCVLPEGPAVPVHDERVRPYRGIPIFKPETVVQHYLTPEELAPYHAQVI